MTHLMGVVAHRLFVYGLCALIALQPGLVAAQSVVPDTSVAGTAPQMDAASNGVPVVNIAPPSGAGVSHNRFLEYNVGSQGLILNNATEHGTSELGGVLLANPRLGSGSARIILNEVTGSNASLLEGFTEIFGDRAELVLANPNGITCDGCGFINTDRTTLTTGLPDIVDGALREIAVTGSAPISIEAGGLNAEDAVALDIVARLVRVGGSVHAEDLRYVLGRNLVEYGVRATTLLEADGSEVPALALDGTLFGAMQAGRIEILATEADGDVRLAGTLVTQRDLVLTAEGRLEYADVAAGGDVLVTSVSGDVVATGETLAEGRLTLEARSGMVEIDEGATLGSAVATEIRADRIAQAGQIGSDGSVTLEASAELVNRGLVSAGVDVMVQGPEIHNAGGVVEATTSITLEGVGGASADRITNTSGLIETAAGDITLRAAEIENARDGFAVEEVVVSRRTFQETDGNPPGGYDYSNISGYMFDGSTVVVEHPFEDGEKGYFDFGPITVTGYETQVSEDAGAAALIASGGDLILEGGAIINSHSAMTALGDIAMTGATLDNLQTNLTQDVKVTGPPGNYNRCVGSPCQWLLNGGGTRLADRVVVDSITATIQAGGSITGSFTDLVNNETITETTDQAALATLGGVAREEIAAPTVGSVDLFSRLDTLPEVLIAPSDPSARYLRETRTAHTDYGTFFGGDYFLSRVDVDAEVLPDRFAMDAELEARLVRQALLEETGRAWLDPAYPDTSGQLRRLIDNAAAVQQDLALTPGIALSAEQVSRLDRDIVWYEVREIEGQRVLVPELYLADASRLRLAPGGAVLEADSIEITAAALANSGEIESRGDTALLALDGAIVSAGGLFRTGADLSLSAAGDVVLTADMYREVGQGGDIQDILRRMARVESGGDVTITSAGAVTLRGLEAAIGGDLTVTADQDITLGAVALANQGSQGGDGWDEVNQVTSRLDVGGAVSLEAGGSLGVAGSAIQAGTDIALLAEGDLSVTPVETWQAGSSVRETSQSRSLRVTNLRSVLEAGGDITLRSETSTITLQAATLNSGGETRLEAPQGGVAFTTARDINEFERQSSSSTLFTVSSRDQGLNEERVQMVSLSAEGGLVIESRDGIIAEYRVPPEGGDAATVLASLAREPGLEWIEDLQARDDVSWQAVQEVYESWDNESTSLSPAAMAVIAIVAVAVIGPQVGQLIVAQAGAGSALTATVGGELVLSSLGTAMSAGVTSLATGSITQAANAAVGGEFDMNAVLLNAVTATLTAGLTSGILDQLNLTDVDIAAQVAEGADATSLNLQQAIVEFSVESSVQVGVTGTAPEDALRGAAASAIGEIATKEIGAAFHAGDIGRASQLIAHAAVGCGTGALAANDCVGGAAGAVAGEIAAEAYLSEKVSDILSDPAQAAVLASDQEAMAAFVQDLQSEGILVSRLAGALTAAAAGGDPDVGASTGGTAAENNALCWGACIIAVVGAVLYLAAEGGGNPYEGLQVVGRGEGVVQAALAEATALGIEGAYAIAPENTAAALELMADAGDLAETVLVYADDATGNIVSGTWEEIPSDVQDAILGGVAIATIVVPASRVGNLSSDIASAATKIDTPDTADSLATNKTFHFSTSGSGTHLTRTTSIDDTDIRINSGHAYNRTHSGGDVSQIGTMDEIETAILNDISSNSRLNGLTGTGNQHTIQVNGQTVIYELSSTPVGPVLSNYYPPNP